MARNGRKMVRNQSQILGISLYFLGMSLPFVGPGGNVPHLQIHGKSHEFTEKLTPPNSLKKSRLQIHRSNLSNIVRITSRIFNMAFF